MFDDHFFKKYMRLMCKGAVQETEFIAWFLMTFDPDTVSDYFVILPSSTQDKIRQIFEASPATEDEWYELALRHQEKAKIIRKESEDTQCLPHHVEWFINDLDGKFCIENDQDGGFCINRLFDRSNSPITRWELSRYAVYALRRACGLYCYEEDWDQWRATHWETLSKLGLHPWILENRMHWYAYLNSCTVPFQDGGLNSFASSPLNNKTEEESSDLVRKINWGKITVEQLKLRHEFMSSYYTQYFFNTQRRLKRLIEDRVLKECQLTKIKQFITRHPESFQNLQVSESPFNNPIISGTVPNLEAFNSIEKFTKDSFSDELKTIYDSGGVEHYIQEMLCKVQLKK